jgi:6-phosphogluconolactonase
MDAGSMKQKTNLKIYKTLDDLSLAVANKIVHVDKRAIDEKGVFSIVLSGGSTVGNLYEHLSDPSFQDQVAWDKVHFYWGDERLVPPIHPESNFGLAKRYLLDHIPHDPMHVFRMMGELEPGEAVEDYKQKLKENAAPSMDWPRFDVVLLGMGSDGHIASIFPGDISEQERISPVVASRAEYQGRPGERISLTPLVFNSARNIFFLVSGENKAPALAKVFGDQLDPEGLPAHRLDLQEGEVTWFVDEPAASLLHEGRIDPE